MLTAACGVGSGTGRSKKEAEQSAARSAPEQLKKRKKNTPVRDGVALQYILGK